MAFTEEERRIIDDLHKREFADMTPEEAQLYGRWCAESAAEKREIELREDALIEELAARGEMHRAQAREAQARFEEHMQRIRARMEGMKHGQQE